MHHTSDIGASDPTIKDRVQKLAEPDDAMKERARRMAEGITQRTSAAITRSIHFIHAHPIASFGLSLGLGFYSRTLLRLGMLAGVGMLVARMLSRPGRSRAAT